VIDFEYIVKNKDLWVDLFKLIFLWVKKSILTLLENLDRTVLRLKMAKIYFGSWFMKIAV
jgi:uncharacterized protein YacL